MVRVTPVPSPRTTPRSTETEEWGGRLDTAEPATTTAGRGIRKEAALATAFLGGRKLRDEEWTEAEKEEIVESFRAGLGAAQTPGSSPAPRTIPLNSEASSSGQQPPPPPWPIPKASAEPKRKVDEFGRRIPQGPPRKTYLLLTTRPGAGKAGIYVGTFHQFCCAANPEERVLPASGFKYCCPKEESGLPEWTDHGHEGVPPRFEL